MSTAARSDELRKNFEGNPRRYFAPLANELRKAGHLSEAIALCRECLPKQPEHMSGYIVFGQALYESGDLSGARMVFEQALSLDPENLKALRHLGDIAKREGDTAGARRWYERVLEADPRNDDIAAQLATLTTPVRVVPAPAAFFAPPTSVSPMPPVPTPLFSMAPIGLGPIPTPVAALRAVDFDEFTARLWVPEPTPTERVASPVETAVGGTVVEESADDPFGFSETATAEVPFELLLEEGLIAPDWPDTSELVARIATPRTATPVFVPSLTPDAVAAFGVESRDPLPAPAPEGKAPVEPTPAAPVEVEAPVGGAVAAAKATIATVRPEFAALFGDGRTNFADSDSESGPVEWSSADVMPEEHNPAFVTATMGELLVSQGFTARAVSVYEELVRRRPYDPVLTSRLAELRARLATDAGPVTPAFTAPASATPLSATAISSGASEAADSEEDQSARVTARERFARLSLRRVPRRTPPRVSVETPATEPAREVPPPTVSDDLAQFSAWFKGLGNT